MVGRLDAHAPQAYARSTFEFTGRKIVRVVFDVADGAYTDIEACLAAAVARD
jgi:hypothetical protein